MNQITLSIASMIAYVAGNSGALAQYSGFSITSDGGIYEYQQISRIEDGGAIVLQKAKSGNVWTMHHYDQSSNPHSQYPSPMLLKLEAHPEISIVPKLIPLGGEPEAFLIPCTSSLLSGRRFGFCKFVLGKGLSSEYGVSGFLETPIAENAAYLGQLGDRIYTGTGVVNRSGEPDTSYGNFGRISALPSSAMFVSSASLQESGAILYFYENSYYAPQAYDRYLIRIDSNGKLDPRFGQGIWVGRGAEDGSYQYSAPFEESGMFYFHRISTVGSIERFSLNLPEKKSEKVGEIIGLPKFPDWRTIPIQTFRLGDGRMVFFMEGSQADYISPMFLFLKKDMTIFDSYSLPLTYPVVTTLEKNSFVFNPKDHVFRHYFLRYLNSYFGGSYQLTWLKYRGDIDSDGDGISDFAETNTGVYLDVSDAGTKPDNPDSDGDGLSDFSEISDHKTNPNVFDSDSDGFSDFYEIASGFSPIDPSSRPVSVMQVVPAIELRIATQVGVVYQVETSSDMQDWVDTGMRIQGTGGEVREIYKSIEGKSKYWRAVVKRE